MNMDFKFAIGPMISLNTSIEINGIFKNEMTKVVEVPKPKFDFRK